MAWRGPSFLPPALQPPGASGHGAVLRVAVSMSGGGCCQAVPVTVHTCPSLDAPVSPSGQTVSLGSRLSAWALGTMYVGLPVGDCPLLSVKIPFVMTPSAVHSDLFLCTHLCVLLNHTHPCRLASLAMTVLIHLDLHIPNSLPGWIHISEGMSLTGCIHVS